MNSGADSAIDSAPPTAGVRTYAAAGPTHLPIPVVLFILSMIIPISFTAGPLVLSGTRIFLLVMAVPLFVRMMANSSPQMRIFDTFLACHALWSVLAIYINNPDRALQFSGSNVLEMYGGYVVARACITNYQQFVKSATFIVFIILLSLPFALIEGLTGRNLLQETFSRLPFFGGIPEFHIDRRLGLQRARFTFAHPIHYGIFCSAIFSMIFIAQKNRLQDSKRRLLGAVSIAGTFLSMSSGPLLTLMGQIYLVAWTWVSRNMKNRWRRLFTVGAIAYLPLELMSDRPLILVILSYMTFNPHTAYWRSLIFEFGIQNVWANPMFGIGLNDWERPAWMYSGSMDNFWLLMGVRYGIPGFLFLAIAWLGLMYKVGTRKFTEDTPLHFARRGWMISITGLTLALATVSVWGSMYALTFFLLGMGGWMLSAPDRGTKRSDRADDAPPTPAQASRHGIPRQPGRPRIL